MEAPKIRAADKLQGPVYSSTFTVSDGFWHHTATSSSFTSGASSSSTGHAISPASTAADAGASSFASAGAGTSHRKTASATMSSGEIAGIAISSVFAVAALASLILYLCARRKGRQQQQGGTRGGSADDEERLRPGTNSPVAVLPKIRRSSSVSTRDDPPMYEEIQHEYPRQSIIFASGATTDGFRQYRFEPPPDQGNKLGP